MRLAIGKTLESGKVEVIDTARQPVRLGRDVFSHGRLSPEIIERSVEAFQEFSRTIRHYEVDQTAAVATSAVREAANGRELTDRVRDETDIEIDVISGIQEARLVHLAVSQKLDMERGEALLVDIGGGSVEVVLTSDGLLIDSKSYDVGTVRMLQVLSDKRRGKERFAQVVEEVCGDVRDWVTGIVGHNLIGRMVGTGGNVEAIGDLTGRRAGKKAMSYANIKDIDRTRSTLEDLSVRRRRKELRLKLDRADVIYPATVVLQSIMSVVWTSTLIIPRVGLREGLLADIAMRREVAAAGGMSSLR
jgi:exopolyphosphatase/guanosine-5'-triphosphate,3'-diphosphate pyrophosphatase